VSASRRSADTTASPTPILLKARIFSLLRSKLLVGIHHWREVGKNQRTEEQEKERTAGCSLKKLACFGKRNQVSQILLLLLKISEFTQRLTQGRGAAESTKLSQDFSTLVLTVSNQERLETATTATTTGGNRETCQEQLQQWEQ